MYFGKDGGANLINTYAVQLALIIWLDRRKLPWKRVGAFLVILGNTSWQQKQDLRLKVRKTKELIMDYVRQQEGGYIPIHWGTAVESQQLQIPKAENVA